MKYILIIIKWGLMYLAVSLFAQVQEGFMRFNIITWQFWLAFVISLVMFEVAHQELKLLEK